MITIAIRSTLFLIILTVALFSPRSFADAELAEKPADVRTENGLTTIAFAVRGGSVKVHLPEDMAVGDTISGTVIAEPQRQPAADDPAGTGSLDGVVIDLGGGRTVPVCDPCSALRSFVLPHVFEQKGGYQISVVQPGAPKTTASVPVARSQPPAPAGTSFPPIAQAGRPLPVSGPFDGDASTTNCMIGGQPAPFLAESPRTAIFRAPSNVTGPANVSLTERGKATQATLRVVRVDLSAAKTNLTRGETMDVHLEIKGLQGESESVPLRLVTSGVANMQGGNMQTIEIRPNDLLADGTFIRDFSLTGTSTGAFNVTATVPIPNPAGGGQKCACECELARTPILTAGKAKIQGGAQHSFSPNVAKAACKGNRCSLLKTEYSWSIGSGSTATYSVAGDSTDSNPLSVDVTKAGTLELTVTVKIKCSDGTTCSATGSRTFTVDTK